MKLTHKLCGAALLAAIGFGVAAPGATSAAPKTVGNLESAGADVKFNTDFVKGSDEGGDSNVGGSGDETPGSGYNTTDANGFGISAVTDIDFGTHAQVITGKTQDIWAQNFVSTNKDGATIENANFIQFEDFIPAEEHPYTIQAELTTPFTTTSNKQIQGATITYTNPVLTTLHEIDSAQGQVETRPNTAEATALVKVGEKTTILNNADSQDAKGYGKYQLSFGTYHNVDDKTNTAPTAGTASTESIKLSFPIGASNVLKADETYHADITWYMGRTPQ